MGATSCAAAPKESAEVIPDKDTAVTAVIVNARGLRDADCFPGTDRYFYCTVGIAGKPGYIHKTRLVKDTLLPTWKEEFVLGAPQFSSGNDVTLSVLESDADGAGHVVAAATLKSRDFEHDGFNGDLQLELHGERLEAYVRLKLKLYGQDFPPGPLDEFTVMLDNPSKKPLGIDFDAQDGCTMYVTEIKPGLIAAYNEEADPGRRVQVGDFIVKVNDIDGKARMLVDTLKAENSLELLVRRPVEIFVAVSEDREEDGEPKTHRPAKRGGGGGGGCMPTCGADEQEKHAHFGMEFPKQLKGTALLITAVMDGPIEDWNTENPDQAVRSGDRVVAVNGKKGKAETLLREMRSSERFTMCIVRPGDLPMGDDVN